MSGLLPGGSDAQQFSCIIKIKYFNIIGTDERGHTAAFSLVRKQSDFLFLFRKNGSISGNTFHKGMNVATNPKIFVLLSSKILLSYRKIGITEKLQITLEAPCMIEVSPNVTHSIEALSDINILECNSIADIANDRFQESV